MRNLRKMEAETIFPDDTKHIEDDSRPHFIEFPKDWRNHERPHFDSLVPSLEKMWKKKSFLKLFPRKKHKGKSKGRVAGVPFEIHRSNGDKYIPLDDEAS